MTALPASTDFTGAAVTEAGFKTAITGQRDFLSGLFGTDGTVATALDTLGALCGGWVSKSAAYTVVAADRGTMIDYASGTYTLTLTAAATLGAGFSFAVRNTGTGVITVDPNLKELIDGASTITLEEGGACIVVCTGSAWRTIGRVVSANGAYRSMQVYTTTGANTWTKPTGLKRVKVTVVGGGGAGASSNASGDVSGGGGGAGGTAIKTIEAASLGSTETATVGAAATDSTFGSHCTGGAGGNASGVVIGGTGGTATSGDINIGGSDGAMGEYIGTYDLAQGGSGGASYLGGGGRGGRSDTVFTGLAGKANTGGGGGGGGLAGATTGAGGAGGTGIIIVEEFF